MLSRHVVPSDIHDGNISVGKAMLHQTFTLVMCTHVLPFLNMHLLVQQTLSRVEVDAIEKVNCSQHSSPYVSSAWPTPVMQSIQAAQSHPFPATAGESSKGLLNVL